MAVNQATGYNRTTNEPLDALYLNSGSVYTSTASVNAAVNINVRHTGSMFNVNGEIYWYKNGTQDSDLVLFNNFSTGSLNGTASWANNALNSELLDGKDGTTYATTASNYFRGNQVVEGYTKYVPSNVSIPTNISGSFIFSSGSEGDMYFAQSNGITQNVTRLRWLEGNMYTGLLRGGVLSSASSTVYNVSSGSGIIVTMNVSLDTEPYPTIQHISWPNLSASIAPFSASYDQTFVAVYPTGSTGYLYGQGVPYSDGQYNTMIPIGVVLHQNHSTINLTKTAPSVGYGLSQRSNVFIKAFGPLKLSGFTFSPSGSSTGSLVVSPGTAYADGANYISNPSNPSYITDSGTNTSKIWRYYQSGSTWIYDTNNGAGYATINPTQYSLNGALTAVPVTGSNREFSIQRVYWFPNSVSKAVVVYYGNATYLTKTDAIANVNVESFIEAPNTSANAIYLGAIVIRNNGSFQDSTSYSIIPGGLFRQVGGSGGGGSVITQVLSGLSDVTISTPSNKQPLVYDTTLAKWINSNSVSASLNGNADTSTLAATASSADAFTVRSISNATVDTDKFIVSDSGSIKYRTGTEVLNDIGGQPSGSYITSLTGEVAASGPGAASAVLANSAVIGKVLTGLNVTGGSIVATDSVLSAFGKSQNQINGLMGGATYQGVWNATTNSPTITSSIGTKGHYYVVNVAGSTNVDGVTDWKVGDWIIFNGVTWDKVDNTDAVSSVNGFVGAVSLTTANIPEVTNLYYTDVRSRASISSTATGLNYNSTTGAFTLASGYVIPTTVQETNWNTAYTNTITSLTTTGSSGAATLSANVLNIPTYTLAGLGGISGTGASGQVAYWNGTSTQTGSSNLTWSNTGFGTMTLGSSIAISSNNAFGLNYITFDALTSGQGISSSFSPSGTPTTYAYNFQFSKSSTANNNSLLIIGGGASAIGNTANKHVITTSADGTATGQPLVLRSAATGTNFGGVNDHVTIFPSGRVAFQNSSAAATDNGVDNVQVNGSLIATTLKGTWGGNTITDGFISSAATWNAKQVAYTNLTTIGALANGNGFLRQDGTGVFSYDTATYYLASNPSGYLSSVSLTSNVTGVLPIANGGTGSSTQNFVDLSSNQTVGGIKTFSSRVQSSGGSLRSYTNGSNIQGAGANLMLSNAAETNFWFQQLNASNNIDWWYFDGISYSNPLYLTTLGDLGILRNTTIGGTLGVTGIQTNSNLIKITGGTIAAGSELSLAWNATTGGAIQSFASLPLALNPLGNATTIGGTLGVTGASTFNNPITIQAVATSGTFANFKDGTNTDAYIGVNNSAGSLAGGIGGVYGTFIASYNSRPIGFGINGTQYLSIASTGAITASGDVTITKTTGTLLDVRATSAGGTAEIKLNPTSNNAYSLYTAGGTDALEFKRNGTTLVTFSNTGAITASGNMSIGGTLGVAGAVNWGSTSGSYMRTVGGTQIFASTFTGTNYLYSGGTDFRINNQADNVTLLTIANSGAATFSNNVSIGGTLEVTGAITASSSVTATAFQVGNGQYYKAVRSSGSLVTDMIGIPSGTDDVRVFTTGAFNVINGSIVTILGLTNTGAATFAGYITAPAGGGTSDSRVKNVHELNAKSSVLSLLSLRKYNFIEKLGVQADDRLRWGFATDDIRNAYPELIFNIGATDKAESLNYTDLHNMAIIELRDTKAEKTELEKLRDEVKELRQQLQNRA